MPLVPDDLEADLEDFFGDLPNSFALAAAEWAAIFQSYSSGVIPASTTVPTAASALESALATAFQGPQPVGAVVDAAFQTFAATVGSGMAPAFVAVPPPSPPGFVANLLPPFPPTHALAAAKWRNVLDVWMRTGTATPSGGGAPVNWS
jgi:hypothetical protein